MVLGRQLTYANVMSTLAVFLVLAGGGAYAASKLKTNSVKSKHIAPDAVQGVDAKESSFGPVPRANQADNAATAGDAASVGGVPVDVLQFGNGIDGAIAGVIDANQNGFVLLAEASIRINCTASPTLQYMVSVGPDTAATLPVEVWIDGTHTRLGPIGPIDINNVALSQDDTVQIQTWSNSGVVSHVVASVSWDPANTECAIAFTTQENVDDGCLSPLPAPGACADLRTASEGNLRNALPGRP